MDDLKFGRARKFYVLVVAVLAWLGALALDVDPQIAGTVILTITAGTVWRVPNS